MKRSKIDLQCDNSESTSPTFTKGFMQLNIPVLNGNHLRHLRYVILRTRKFEGEGVTKYRRPENKGEYPGSRRIYRRRNNRLMSCRLLGRVDRNLEGNNESCPLTGFYVFLSSFGHLISMIRDNVAQKHVREISIDLWL